VLNLILRREEPEGSFDRLSLAVAVRACIRAVTSTGPLLLAVDDVQWLDRPTVRTQARRSLPHGARQPIRRGASGRRTVGEPLIPRRRGAPTFGRVTGTVDVGFVAECYWAGVRQDDLRSLDERVASCASELARTGERVRYLGSMLIVEDEAVRCLFEGSATAVRSVAERAAIPFGRILRGTGAPWSKERSSHDAAQARRRHP
jgi:hypothetical protein